MSKDFYKGSQDGDKDGKVGGNKLASRSVKRLLKTDQILPDAQNRHDEYMHGNVKGIENKVRVKNVSSAPTGPGDHRITDVEKVADILSTKAYSSINNKTTSERNSNMTRSTSFAYQIELLENLKSYLQDFQERLLGVSSNYQRKVDALHGEGGLMDETYRDFVEAQLAPTREMIQRLVDHIGSNDIPAVEKEIKFLEQKL